MAMKNKLMYLNTICQKIIPLLLLLISLCDLKNDSEKGSISGCNVFWILHQSLS